MRRAEIEFRSLTQNDFVRLAGEDAVLWIAPAAVPCSIGTKWPVGKHRLKRLARVVPKPLLKPLRPVLKRREPFAIPAARFGPPLRTDTTVIHHRLRDFIEGDGDPRRTLWFRTLDAELKRNGTVRHKSIVMRSEQDIADFLSTYVGGMVRSLKAEGYRKQAAGYESTAAVGPEGRLYKSGSGNHRFCAAGVLQLERYPLRIVAAHEDWLAAQFGPDRRRVPMAALLEALHKLQDDHARPPAAPVS